MTAAPCRRCEGEPLPSAATETADADFDSYVSTLCGLCLFAAYEEALAILSDALGSLEIARHVLWRTRSAVTTAQRRQAAIRQRLPRPSYGPHQGRLLDLFDDGSLDSAGTP